MTLYAATLIFKDGNGVITVKQAADEDLLIERIEEIEREGDAKIKLVQEQLAKATGQAKANLERRVTDERAKHNARAAKLRGAWQLVKEAAAI